MFKSIIEFIKEIFSLPSSFSELEAHIKNGNPQSTAEVEQLEREFYHRQQRQMLWHFKE